jgi:hypothetical protein
MSLTKVRNQMIEGAAVNVLDFGAVGDGVTDDTAAIQAAIYHAESTGINEVIYPCTDAYYNITLCLVCPPYVSHRGLGGLAKIKNFNTNPAAFMYRTVFLTGNLSLDFIEALTVYDCGTVSVGNTVTLTTPAEAANFTVGDQVITRANDFRLVSGMKLYKYMHLNRVESIAGGVITLKYPIDESYAGAIGRLASGSSTTQPINIPLYFAENSTFSNLDIEAPDGIFPGYNACYNVTFKDCIMKGRWTIYGNCYQYCSMYNIRGYFSDLVGEFAQNSLHSAITDSVFSYYEDPAITTPSLRLQMAEATRGCKFNNNVVDVGDISVTPGFSLFALSDAQYCEVNNNKLYGSNAASQITVAVFVGNTTGLRCSYNSVSGNTIKMLDVRLLALLTMVDSTNTGNRFDRNTATDLTGGDFEYVITMTNSYGNFIRGNSSTFGAIYIGDTVSADNIITENSFPAGFGPNERSLNNEYYRQNILQNNVSDSSKVKQTLALTSVANVTAPASVATEVFAQNIGTSMATRDSYRFSFAILPTGGGATKPIEFKIRNITDAANLVLFSHTIPAASVGVVMVTATVSVKGPGSNVIGYATVFDTSAGTTTNYATSLVRPAANKDLSFIMTATPGAGTSCVFLQIISDFSNPYN